MTQRHGAKGYMLRRSPHNEDFVLAVARSKEGLVHIAEEYIQELFGPLKRIKSEVDLEGGRVYVVYDDGSGENETTFYVSDVEIL